MYTAMTRASWLTLATLMIALAICSSSALAQSQNCEITGETKLCPGQTTKLCGPDGATSYQWYIPGMEGPREQCIEVSEPFYYELVVGWPDGTYTICAANVTYEDGGGTCSITGDRTICEGGSTELCGPSEASSYSWTGPNGFTASSDCIVVTEPGDYTLVLDGKEQCGSTCTATVVTRTSDPCEIKGDTLFCKDESSELCGPEGGATYSWKGPEGFTGDTQCVTVTLPGEYTLDVTYAEGCDSHCKISVETEDCRETLNCPRTPGFWTAQCEQKNDGSAKFTADEVQRIAARVDELSSYFNWVDGTEMSAFCAIINPSRPMTVAKQAKRHFAAFLANVATGQLGLIADNGDEIFIDLSTEVDCGVQGVDTLEDLLAAADAAIAAGSSTLSTIKDCLDATNNGVGIGTVCEEKSGDVSKTDAQERLEAKLVGGGSRILLAPNPFKMDTTIQFAVPSGETQKVEIGVYDVSGRRVNVLASGEFASGVHSVIWNGTGASGARVANGVYYVRALIGSEAAVQRVLFLK